MPLLTNWSAVPGWVSAAVALLYAVLIMISVLRALFAPSRAARDAAFRVLELMLPRPRRKSSEQGSSTRRGSRSRETT